MELFRHDGENRKNGSSNSGWEDMDKSITREREKNARQERKIIAAFAYGRDGWPDTSIMNDRDVDVSDDMYNAVIDGMIEGKITRAQERELLSHIKGPCDYENGVVDVTRKLSNYDKRVLADMTSIGFDNWKNVNESCVSEFIQKFETPIEFTIACERFLDGIEAANNPGERQKYERALADFRMKVYGKREEYWQRIQSLEGEAHKRSQSAQNVTVPQPNGYRSYENERSQEWQPGEAGFWQTSRAQARGGLVTKKNIEQGMWATDDCQDSYFVRPDQQFYGVFDGAGGHEGGREASRMVADVVRECSDRYSLENGSHLAFVLNRANERVARDPRAGISTAVLTKVVRIDGRLKLAYASVGDSRIYIVDKEGNARLITRDEGEGRYLYNSIGDGDGSKGCTRQYGEIDLHKGDRIVLCSDGITGDYGEDLMSERELGFIVSHSWDARNASQNLIANARKKDDRTAIVFGEF